MEKIREMIKNANDKQLLEMWEELAKKNKVVSYMLANIIIETELEERNIIKLNEETFEYELVK